MKSWHNYIINKNYEAYKKAIPYKDTIWKIEFVKNSFPCIWHKCKKVKNRPVITSYYFMNKKWFYCSFCMEKFPPGLISFLNLLDLKNKIK